MGLDITHQRATLIEPVRKGPFDVNYITEDDFKDFNVPFEHFRQYVQQVNTENVLDSVIIVEDRKFFAEVSAFFEKRDLMMILAESETQRQEELAIYEESNCLSECQRFIDDQVVGERWKVLYYYEVIKKTGFYTETVGEQRKGVNGRFWERFYSDEVFNFALYEDFQYAYSCVDHYWASDTDEEVALRKQKFKEDFVDKFLEGASFLSLSY